MTVIDVVAPTSSRPRSNRVSNRLGQQISAEQASTSTLRHVHHHRSRVHQRNARAAIYTIPPSSNDIDIDAESASTLRTTSSHRARLNQSLARDPTQQQIMSMRRQEEFNAYAEAEAYRHRLRHQEREEASQRAQRQGHDELEAPNHSRTRQQQLAPLQRQVRPTYQRTGSTPSPPSPPSGPSQQHRVYLIDCRSCGAFLTDRGMKAVLLLRPHITLYSTDAMPNCGPLHPPSRFAEPCAPNEPVVERTCDCLTQTLGCYGCGSAVGYHIVSPCERCTSSVAKHQRSSNGHRTVLHCAEISVRERRYVPGEPGVAVAPAQLRWPTCSGRQSALNAMRFNEASLSPLSTFRQTRLPQRTSFASSSTASNSQQDGEDEEDDDEEEERDMYEANDKLAVEEHDFVQNVAFTTFDSKLRPLRRGDIVYWSDLVYGGERASPIDSDDMLAMPVAGR